MYEFPSASKMREPSPRSMNRGSPPTERNARTGLLTPPGIRFAARCIRRAERSMASIVLASTFLSCKRTPSERLPEVYIFKPVSAVRALTLLGEPAGYVRGVVADDHVRAGALDSGERLEDHHPLVEPAVLRRGFDHRVLPAHAVRRDGQVRRLSDQAKDVEVRQGGLDHHEVRPLLDIQLDLEKRLAGVGRVHLVAAPITEGGGALGGLAERSVEGRGVLGGVGHDRGVFEALAVQLAPYGRHPAIHHVRGSDDVRPGLGLGGGGPGEELEADVVQDLAGVLLHDPAVTVARVLAQAHVRDHDEIRYRVLYGAGRELDDPLRIICPARRLVLLIGDAEEQHARYAELVGSLCLGDGVVYGELEDAGHGGDRVSHVLPDGHEDGIDKVARRERGLAHQAAQSGRTACPPQPLNREWHPYSPLFAGSAAKRSTTASINPGIVYSLASTSTRMP